MFSPFSPFLYASSNRNLEQISLFIELLRVILCFDFNFKTEFV